MSRSVLLLVTTLLAGCEYDVSGTTPTIDDSGLPSAPDAAAGETPDAATDAAASADAPPRAPDAATARSCPDGYTADPVTGSAYRVGTFLLDWRTAEGACADDGAGTHLVVIGDGQEFTRVKTLSGGQAVWLGLSDRIDEHDFVSVTGESTSFAPWAFGEPNDGGLFGEDCVELRDGAYNDQGCGSIEYYVCECDGRAEDPSAF